MKLTTTAFADSGIIPGEFAFAVIDPATHVKLSANRNPDFAWSGVPSGTRSLALLCHDPDVPSRGDDVNQEGRAVPASLPRVAFFHWALDRPRRPRRTGIERGEHSDGVVARGKPGPQAPREGRHGINDYTAWFAGDKDMGGDYYGYDGPCPPWNDEIAAPLRVHALRARRARARRCPTSSRAPQARAAMDGHILAQASVTGRYTLNPAVEL